MNTSDKIFVAGHRGLAGSAIVRALQKAGFKNLVLKTHEELDLLDAKAVSDFFSKERPEYVFLAAAHVGGIAANNAYPADLIYENLVIETSVIHSAHEYKVKKLLFLGSSCMYPRLAEQPMKEESLLTGPLEPSNKPYAVAKIAGVVMCQSFNKQYGDNFIAVMPANLYGPNDDFDLQTSHVVAALIRKFHEAKQSGVADITLWGTGAARREFLHADDLGEAVLFLMNTYNDPAIINIGTGEDVTIKALAETIQKIVGFTGEIRWDSEKPDGAPRKVVDVSKIHALGWRHAVALPEGLRDAYEWYRGNNSRR
ncbi:MAG: GDP-L-fucose synthase [bacterium]|nr:GDP-L-fucose synthase [bacterium]